MLHSASRWAWWRASTTTPEKLSADTATDSRPSMRWALPGASVWLSSGHSDTPTPAAPSASAAQIQRDGRSCSTSIASSEIRIGAV
jgi:hypothetical protein